MKIARAISGYSKGCGDLLLYVDIKPRFTGWETLLADLRYYQNIKILVTIREEDWHMADILPSFSYEGIVLELSKEEARKIYDNFPTDRLSESISSFENAWKGFGEEGPLLEFVHLITYGGNLTSRLKSQIMKIHDSIDRNERKEYEIDILRIVAVASAFGASCKISVIMDYLNLNTSTVFRNLEEEYLIKETGDYVTGLHSIRSEKITSFICDNEDLLTKAVCECISLITSNNLCTFLLNAFIHCPNNINSIIHAINCTPVKNWTMARNILDALLWVGVKEYVEDNTELLNDLYNKFKDSPAMYLDAFVADREKRLSMLELMSGSLPSHAQDEVDSFISRQIDKSNVYKYSSSWFNATIWNIENTSSPLDLSSIGKVCFWASKTKSKIPIDQNFIDQFINIISDLRTDVIADFIVGIYYYDENLFNQTISQRDHFIKKFKEETYTLKLIESSDTISIHYLIPIQTIEGYDSIVATKNNNEEINYNDESVYRINLLRKLFPDKQTFTANGVGHNLVDIEDIEYYFEQTEKKISIEHLYLNWETELNGIFCNLSFYKFREKTWEGYVKTIIEQRKIIIEIMKLFSIIATENLSNKDFHIWLKQHIKIGSFDLLDDAVIKYPPPQCIVDPFGFTGGSLVKHNYKIPKAEKELFNNYRDFVNTWSNVNNQFLDSMIYSAAYKCENNFSQEDLQNKSETAHCCLRNIVNCLKNTPFYQKSFNNLFYQRFSLNELIEIEQLENIYSIQLLGLANISINEPKRRISNPTGYVSNLNSFYEKMIIDLKKVLKKNSNKDISFSLWELDKLNSSYPNTSWIKVDLSDITMFDTGLLKVKKVMGSWISSLSPIKEILFNINNSHINIVLFYNGQMIMDAYFSYYLLSIIQNGFSNIPDDLSHVQPFSEDWIKVYQAGLSPAKKKVALDFIEANSTFYAILTHLRDVNKLIECDDDVETFISDYVKNLISTNNPLQKLFDCATALLDLCNDEDMEENLLIYYTVQLILEWQQKGINPFWEISEETAGKKVKEFNLYFRRLKF